MIEGVTTVVYNRRLEKFLIVRRSEDKNYYPGIWQFPGGVLEDGETIREGALRELEEETGIYSTEVKEKGEYKWTSPYDGSQMKSHVFLVEVEEKEVQLSREHVEHQWVELSELEDFETFEFIHKDLEAVDVL